MFKVTVQVDGDRGEVMFGTWSKRVIEMAMHAASVFAEVVVEVDIAGPGSQVADLVEHALSGTGVEVRRVSKQRPLRAERITEEQSRRLHAMGYMVAPHPDQANLYCVAMDGERLRLLADALAQPVRPNHQPYPPELFVPTTFPDPPNEMATGEILVHTKDALDGLELAPTDPVAKVLKGHQAVLQRLVRSGMVATMPEPRTHYFEDCPHLVPGDIYQDTFGVGHPPNTCPECVKRVTPTLAPAPTTTTLEPCDDYLPSEGMVPVMGGHARQCGRCGWAVTSHKTKAGAPLDIHGVPMDRPNFNLPPYTSGPARNPRQG